MVEMVGNTIVRLVVRSLLRLPVWLNNGRRKCNRKNALT